MKEEYKSHPIEELHNLIMDEFHRYRIKYGSKVNVNVTLDGIKLTRIIANAKTKYYDNFKDTK